MRYAYGSYNSHTLPLFVWLWRFSSLGKTLSTEIDLTIELTDLVALCSLETTKLIPPLRLL